MISPYCLNQEYSTTRRITRTAPMIEDSTRSKSKSALFLPLRSKRNGEGGLRKQGNFKTEGYFDNGEESVDGDVITKRNPLITVITAVFNAHKTLEQTILSVINQSYDNVEYIIIDGGSTDGTIDIIRKYEHAIDYWVSEPDAGVYQAMNKGVAVATGKWVYFLGADDKINTSDCFENVAVIENIDDFLLIYGDVVYENGKLRHGIYTKKALKIKNTIHHQAAIYSRKVFDCFRYNEAYRISSDYELNLKMVLLSQPALKIDVIMACCGSDGISGYASFAGYHEVIKIRSTLIKYSFLYNLATIIRFTAKKVIISLRRRRRD